MRLLPRLVAVCALFDWASNGQTLTTFPETSHVLLYFPHLVDGGPPAQRWQSKLTFSNPNNVTVSVLVNFYAENGSSLPLDFGSGPANQLSFTIPPFGTRVFRSSIASTSEFVMGWALASATAPVQGLISFRALQNGVPFVELSASGTLPALQYSSAATPSLGLALANPNPSISISVSVVPIDANGFSQGRQVVTVPPSGHVSFNLSQRFPTLPSTFSGQVVITGINLTSEPKDSFVAWTASSDGSTISTLPEGRVSTPLSQWDRIWLVFQKVLMQAQKIQAFGTQPVLLQIRGEPILNVTAANNTVVIWQSVAELISDSESELGFIVAHELGHIYQQRVGRLEFDSTNKEFDADIFGAFVAMSAGYDPYAAAGALAKLAMATGSSGLITQTFEDLEPADAHRSFTTRLELVFQTLIAACQTPTGRLYCPLYKSIFHPHFPFASPLGNSLDSVKTTRDGNEKQKQ